MNRITLWFMSFVFVVGLWGQKTMSVCDLLAHAAEQRGRIVSVRGSLHMGREQVALYGTDCTFVLETNGYKWPTALWLTPPDGIPEEPVNFVIDERVMEEFHRDLVKFQAANPSARDVPVVVVGKFEYPRKFVGGIGMNGKWVGNGYGHLRTYPGQIVIRRMQLDSSDGR